MKTKFWILLTIIGGILMIIASTAGSAGFYTFLYNQISMYIAEDLKPFFEVVLTLLKYIAIGGGYSVLAGVVLVMLNQYRLGRFIISVATSFGLLGLILYIVTWVIGYANIALHPEIQLVLDQLYSLFTFNSGLGFAGTVVAIIGRMGLKKPKEEEVSEYDKNDLKTMNNLKSKYCPNCGTILPIEANYCRECGTNFE